VLFVLISWFMLLNYFPMIYGGARGRRSHLAFHKGTKSPVSVYFPPPRPSLSKYIYISKPKSDIMAVFFRLNMVFAKEAIESPT